MASAEKAVAVSASSDSPVFQYVVAIAPDMMTAPMRNVRRS
jgi:hypothetical protein